MKVNLASSRSSSENFVLLFRKFTKNTNPCRNFVMAQTRHERRIHFNAFESDNIE